MDVDTSASGQGGPPVRTLAPGVVPNAPYVGRAPAPPSIPVPLIFPPVTRSASQTVDSSACLFKPYRTCARTSQELPNTADDRLAQRQSRALPLDSLGRCEDAGTPSRSVCIQPSLLNAGILGMSPKDIAQITGGHRELVNDDVDEWQYESRRTAQAILDFMYLGPSAVLRDAAFLQDKGITMVVSVRDSRFARARLLSANRVVADLGIEVQYVDVVRADIIKTLSVAVEMINKHMLGGTSDSPRKVLVFCETGNGHSAAIVAAYIMTMYGLDLIPTLQFVNSRRFCVNFDEDTKHMLEVYSQLLQARRDVDSASLPNQNGQNGQTLFEPDSQPSTTAGQQQQEQQPQRMQQLQQQIQHLQHLQRQQQQRQRRDRDDDDGNHYQSSSGSVVSTSSEELRSRLTVSTDRLRATSRSSNSSRPKRRFHETMDADVDERMEVGGSCGSSRDISVELNGFHLDMERYQNRQIMQPFKDVGDTDMQV